MDDSTPTVLPACLFDGKVCTRCGLWHPLIDYHRRQGTLDGRRSECRECSRARKSRWFGTNRKRCNAVRTQYRNDHIEAEREGANRRYRQNADAINAAQREAYRVDPEYKKAAARKHRQKYPERCRARVKRYLAEHPDWKRAYDKRYNETHRDELRPKALQRQKRYYERHTDLCILRGHKARAKRQEDPGDLTHEEWRAIIVQQRGLCARCQRHFCRAIQPTRDHIVPLSLGGRLTRDNVQALCRSCNASKGTKTIDYRPSR